MSKLSFAKRHNTPTNNFTFEMDGKDLPFIDLKELVAKYGKDKIHTVRIIYINKKGIHGDNPNVVTDHYIVNAPSHMLETAKEILLDAESVNLINGGYVGFKIYEYTNKFGLNYAIEWVDLDGDK